MDGRVSHKHALILIAVAGCSTLAGWVGAWSVFGSRGASTHVPQILHEGDIPDPIETRPTEYQWTRQPAPLFPIPPYAEHLKNVTIVLDPGHIGQAARPGFKVGPTGLREALVNLAVANFLREFLEAAGARVLMTRDKDASLGMSDEDDLADRAAIANRSGADLLLSIHHNAAGSDANFTTIYFHAGPDHSPASIGAARHILWGLNDALRLEQHIPVALATDLAMYRGTGFRLLRLTEIPAVLSEASFFTNRDEENRLRDETYNRREAYGLFLGLARWAQAGLPRVSVVEPERGSRQSPTTLRVKLDDGLTSRGGMMQNFPKISARSINVEFAGAAIPFKFDPVRAEITLELPTIPKIGSRVYVDFQNIFGQHVSRPWLTLE